MSSRKFRPRKRSKSKDATLRDIKKAQKNLELIRKRPKGVSTVPPAEELKKILKDIERDYSIETPRGMGKFRLKQKKVHQKLRNDYIITTIVATPEEVIKEGGKIVQKVIPENLEFVVTIKSSLKDNKKDIHVSIMKPKTSEVHLGEDIQITYGGTGDIIYGDVTYGGTPVGKRTTPETESERLYKEVKQLKTSPPRAPPSAGTPPSRASLQVQLARELRKETEQRRIIAEALTDLDNKLDKDRIKYGNEIITRDELIKRGRSLANEGNTLLKEKNIKDINIIFNEDKLRLEKKEKKKKVK
jgi:hypothetical protein